MVKKLSSVILVACCFVFLSPPLASAGIEPLPWFPNIGLIQLRLIQIGQNFTLPPATRDSLVAINQRLNTLLNDWVTPELATKGNDVIDRISGILFDPQPEPPGFPEDYAIQLITIMDRISSILFDPQPEPPGYVAQGFDVMDRISQVLFDPQPEPPGHPQDLMAQEFGILDSISRVLFDPQPEPPGFVAQGFNVLDNISWALFDPQPEPPGLPHDLQGLSISIMFQVAGVMERTSINGLLQGTIPGLNALEQLSGHLVDAVVRGKADKAAAQVGAMSQIAEQYAGY